MKFFNILILFIIFPKFLFSNVIDNNDLVLLNLNDKKIFLKKCYLNSKFSNIPKCLNFLGIKIFLYAYQNKDLSKKKFQELYKKSIFYLEISAKNGLEEAYKNLGWIYSIDRYNLQDLEKSSMYYEKSMKKKKTPIINSKKNNIKLKSSVSEGYSDVLLVISLIKKLAIYYEHSKSNKNKYISDNEYEKLNRDYKVFLNTKKINPKKFSELEKKVLQDNDLIFAFLKDDLKNFNNKNKDDYNKLLNQLKDIIDN